MIENKITTMRISFKVLKQLRNHKLHPRESDNDCLDRLLKYMGDD